MVGDGESLRPFSPPWFDGLARILRVVEESGVWPEGFLDAYIAMIPKSGGDATPLRQWPLCELPVVYRIWASARMMQLEPCVQICGCRLRFERWRSGTPGFLLPWI